MRSHWRGARVCLALLVAAGSAHAQPPGDSIADGAVAVAVARETAASGFVGMTQARLGKQLYVERVPVATATDVVAITRQASPEKTYLGVILLPDADARLRSRSEAMLTGGDVYVVLLVEGRLVASAKLDINVGTLKVMMNGGDLEISGKANEHFVHELEFSDRGTLNKSGLLVKN